MFTLPMDLDERVKQMLAGRVCTAENGMYIRRSDGRRKSGRLTRYWIHHIPDHPNAIRFEAANDNEAVEIANQKMEGWE